MGLEILSASKIWGLKKVQLEDIQKGTISLTYKPNFVQITIYMRLAEKEKDISIHLTVDLKKCVYQENIKLVVSFINI